MPISDVFVHGKREEHWQDFKDWCYRGGLNCDYLEIKEVNPKHLTEPADSCHDCRQYGLFAKKDIDKNELVISVPDDLMLTTDSIDDPTLVELAKKDPILREMPNILLAFQLMHEYSKGSDSKWSSYINIFPDKYTTPLYFTDEDISYLRGSPTAIDAIKLCRSIYRQYAWFCIELRNSDSLYNKLNFTKIFCFDFYRWAVSSVMTRQNILPSQISPSGQRTALIPFWDMSNHEDGVHSTDYDVDSKKALCYAMKNFHEGDEFTIYYGKRANGDFLVNNGFIDPNNSYNVCYIYLKNGPIKGVKDVREAFGISQSSKFILLPKSLGYHKNLLYLYVLVQIDAEILREVVFYIKDGLIDPDEWITSQRQMNKSIDEHVESGISKRCEMLLKMYESINHNQHMGQWKKSQPKQPESDLQKQLVMLIELEKEILKSHIIPVIKDKEGQV